MNVFQMIMIVFPLIAAGAGVIGYLLFKNVLIMPVVVWAAGITAAITIFNSSFLLWPFIYAALSWAAGIITKSIIIKSRLTP
ncbi:DUF2651 family protein [Alkalicoccus halolimnae]|uniref:DUF2651 family protein n=1 Tax=Alkalicoccus halolimnae TaxID=1667239 RepID=A0AAJ8N1P1_9BACI|nr:DUF2651 family protein [Alkalicoccus halolimnae]